MARLELTMEDALNLTPAEREKILAGEFYAHEALDRAHLASTFFDEHVLQHPYVQAHDALRPAADKVMEALFDFHQLAGRHQPGDGRTTL